MKIYPSIEYWNKGLFGESIIAFDKLDGSCLRAEWSKKLSKKTHFTNGFGKFGTRRQMIDQDDLNWGNGIQLFMKKYSEDLDKIFRENKDYRYCDRMTVYFEYFGPHSFAGQHEFIDKDNMSVVIFDIDAYKKGIISPRNFVNNFGHLDIPNIIYEGPYTEELITKVRNNEFNLNEGVVCKGVRKTKGQDITWMIKIKTNQWIERVREKMGMDKLLEELNGDKSLL